MREQVRAYFARLPEFVADEAYYAPADLMTHWHIGEQGFWPANEGRVGISKEDGRVLQMDEISTGLPPDFPLLSASERAVFDYVQVGSKLETLPVASGVTWERQDTGKMYSNRNTYSNYRAAGFSR